MRCFSIVALCLVAACANAASISDVRKCVRNELKQRVQQIRQEVDSRLKRIADEGNESARRARDEFEKKADEFQQAMSEPLDQARTEYEGCVQGSSGFIDRAKCLVNMGRDLLTKVIPIASEKTVDLATAINEIATEFRDNRKAGLEDLREKGKQFAKDVVSSVRDCVSA